ncbi:hypothetical protein MY10362_002328 [Beauveria mimosiformis]
MPTTTRTPERRPDITTTTLLPHPLHAPNNRTILPHPPLSSYSTLADDPHTFDGIASDKTLLLPASSSAPNLLMA